ncbi:FKBP-type peptidyl-prolyl cis-trans isomerase [Candidatus Dojkabacteria bacterium]|uniref:Peptidyl-prolyl cis-trans isomerase n=1 Tax=Candidatus Dojkabacteria bacterium TaxID=2099670 RepID=A0A955LAI9_9BACT|nr:FKBP-type peptidyl-prolyl cis-trans isomerase [Candidatus Dojkabacteria bacterium]
MKSVKVLVFLIPVLGLGAFLMLSRGSVNNNNYVPYESEGDITPNNGENGAFTSKLVNEEDFAKTTSEEISELDTEVLLEGTGDQVVQQGDTVRANYRGWLAVSGEEFDSSFKSGSSEGIEFSLNSVIEGWSKGVPGMKKGEIRRIYIPSDLAYKDVDRPGIPANSDLIFDVELVDIVN